MKIDRLHYITNATTVDEIILQVDTFIKAGGKWIQLRIKQEDINFLDTAKIVKEKCAGKAKLIINDHVEIAKKIDADGVHLGLEDMPIAEARNILGEHKIIGGTANTREDCFQRINDGIDYIGLGPYRTTTTKKKLSPILGLKGYQDILSAKEISVPVIAIGGIEEDDIETLVKETSIFGIAVAGLIEKSQEKKQLIERINKSLEMVEKN